MAKTHVNPPKVPKVSECSPMAFVDFHASSRPPTAPPAHGGSIWVETGPDSTFEVGVVTGQSPLDNDYKTK